LLINLCARLLLASLLLGACTVHAGAIVYPRVQESHYENYFVKVLQLAVEKAAAGDVLKPSNVRMEKGRAFLELERGAGVDVVWAVTTREREKSHLPIRIPLDKGLAGWRIFLVNKKDKDKFRDVKELAELRPFVSGQGAGWPDVDIFRANGLAVITGFNYEGLFKMLQAGRFDYFPRSIMQAWGEERQHRGNDLAVDQYLALRYPSAIYFFVNKNNPALARRLEDGLRAAIKDGSFDKLFHEYNDAAIRRSALGNRTIIQLTHPGLPDHMPVDHKALWFSP
jgi:ABC-type amino acid transport substrate-binding protein